jgi:hypothetical protein
MVHAERVNEMITKQKYEAARSKLKEAQDESSRASRKGDQKALDRWGKQASAALAVIAAYKEEQGRKK